MGNAYFMFIGALLFLIGSGLGLSWHFAHKKFLKSISDQEKNTSFVKTLTENNKKFILRFCVPIIIIGIVIFVSSVASPRFFLTQI